MEPNSNIQTENAQVVTDLFGAPIAEAANAVSDTAPSDFASGASDADELAAPAGPAKAPAKRGRRGKNDPPPPPTETQRQASASIIATVDAVYSGRARRIIEDIAHPSAQREATIASMALTPDERRNLSDALARGLAANGQEIPWWVGLGLAFAGAYMPREGLLRALVDANEKAKAPANG